MKNRNFAIFVILTILVIFGAYRFKEQRTEENVHPISYQQLLDKRDDERFSLVYVGRPDCPDCQKYQKRLYNVAFAQRIPIYYYNTQKDRETASFNEILQTLSLTEVPALYIVGNDQLVKLDPEIIDAPKFEAMKIDYHL